jgi:hypothetical protein
MSKSKIAVGLATALALVTTAGASPASAELYSITATIGSGGEIPATLQPASSSLIKDTGGLANDTCVFSEMKGRVITQGGTSTYLSLRELYLGGCSHTTTPIPEYVITGGYWQYGELIVRHIPGTTNGTVVSRGLRITIKSTVFGISCTANTGVGTTIGTLTGAATGNATLDINGVISLENGCGDSTWTGTYNITSPIGLHVEEK